MAVSRWLMKAKDMHEWAAPLSVNAGFYGYW